MREIECTNSLFEQPWWLDIVAPGNWGESVVKNDNGEIIGRLPYVIRKGIGGNKIVMPPNTQTLGPWIKDREVKKGNSQFLKQKEIIYELLSQLPKANKFEMTLDSSNHYILPFKWKGFSIFPTFSYRISDLTDLENIFFRFGKSTKKNIRKAQSESIISYETDVDILYEVMNETYKHQNRSNPDSKKFISCIVEGCEKTGHGKMFTARDKDGNVQVAAYLIFDDKVAYSILSGSDPRYRGSGAKSLIYWEEIQYASKVAKVFDFEGSMIEGIENIMRQFGGHQVINYHISKSGVMSDIFAVMKPRIKKLIGYKM